MISCIVKHTRCILRGKHEILFSSRTLASKHCEKAVQIITGRHLLPMNSKESGLHFKITYVDESEKVPSISKTEQPVVVMLHGAPGSCHDFEAQIDFFIRQGTRVIVPNFPALSEMQVHRSPQFRNSPRNRAELVVDFLHALDIRKVDLMVAHSTSAYTTMCLQRDPEKISIRSLALVSPPSYQKALLKPWWFFKLIEWMTFNKTGYAILKFLTPLFMNYILPIKYNTDLDGPLISISSLTGRSPQEAFSMLQELSSTKIPVLFVYSKNDNLVAADLSEDMIKILGGTDKNMWIYDCQGSLKSKGIDESNIRFVCLEAGTHFALQKFPETLNQELLQHLRRVQ